MRLILSFYGDVDNCLLFGVLMSTHKLKISSRIELIDEKLARIGEPDALAQLETQKNDCLSSIARLKYETLTFDAQALIFYKWVLVRTFRQIDGEELVSSDIDDMEGIDFLKIANIDVSFTTHSRDAKPTKHKKKHLWKVCVKYASHLFCFCSDETEALGCRLSTNMATCRPSEN